jgi:hypothetical protein
MGWLFSSPSRVSSLSLPTWCWCCDDASLFFFGLAVVCFQGVVRFPPGLSISLSLCLSSMYLSLSLSLLYVSLSIFRSVDFPSSLVLSSLLVFPTGLSLSLQVVLPLAFLSH